MIGRPELNCTKQDFAKKSNLDKNDLKNLITNATTSDGSETVEGRAHHMFSRILKQRIYEFISRICFIRRSKFSTEIKIGKKNDNITVDFNKKGHFVALFKALFLKKSVENFMKKHVMNLLKMVWRTLKTK